MKSIDLKRLRQFGIVIGFGLPLIIGWLIPIIYGYEFRLWTIWFGFVLIFLGLIRPNLLFYPYKGWIKLGYTLGRINSLIILGIIFIVILVPISFLMKLLCHDPLKIRKSNKSTFKQYRKNTKIELTRIF